MRGNYFLKLSVVLLFTGIFVSKNSTSQVAFNTDHNVSTIIGNNSISATVSPLNTVSYSVDAPLAKNFMMANPTDANNTATCDKHPFISFRYHPARTTILVVALTLVILRAKGII